MWHTNFTNGRRNVETEGFLPPPPSFQNLSTLNAMGKANSRLMQKKDLHATNRKLMEVIVRCNSIPMLATDLGSFEKRLDKCVKDRSIK